MSLARAPDGEARFSPRPACARCARPRSVCLCSHLVELRTRTSVLILQHPRESVVPINTARIADLMLPACERRIGVDFSGDAVVRAALERTDAPPILLFPGEGARDLALEPPAGPVTLVVIDGTWWQASKLFKSNPALARLPRYALNPAQPSRYRIRREPALHCISTLEALVEALLVLEADDRVRGLLGAFDALVEQQLAFAERGQKRHFKRPRTPRVPASVTALRARAGDLVVGYGEANAWPRGTPLGPTPEIVHWAAERLATGERFEAFIAPRLPLSPSFAHHTSLPVERVVAGESVAAVAERWAAFVRPGDVLCGWGFFASELLRREGFALPERSDMRLPARRVLRRNPGDVQNCAALLGHAPGAAWAPGRTGARLAGLATVTRALSAAAEPERT